MHVFALLPLILAGCGQDVSIAKQAVCDGALQGPEETVDSPFDADGDGFFDGGNAGCASVYAAANLDCDDGNAQVHPGAAEAGCDGIDNDCDAATVDADDLDADGYDACTDCADADATVSPGTVEIACNGIDDDCDAATSDGTEQECRADLSGDFDLDTRVQYECAWGFVAIDFDLFEITDRNPEIRVYGEGTNAQPGTMVGTFTTDADFEAENVISGGCDETYAVTGAFTSNDTFEATFTATFTGGAGCGDCRNQSWDVVGTRR